MNAKQITVLIVLLSVFAFGAVSALISLGSKTPSASANYAELLLDE